MDGDLFQDEANDAVVGLQHDLPEFGEDTEPDPLVATVADRGGRAGRAGDRSAALEYYNRTPAHHRMEIRRPKIAAFAHPGPSSPRRPRGWARWTSTRL
ncbi:hypothetical protein GCM10022403_061900 [Streptomyces coacervatus]|uniref:Uncharacterized protein n=1 Tax=Streptomyces coacervatus TaxID=647381 RepID=A0ABP7IJV7_9ACTN